MKSSKSNQNQSFLCHVFLELNELCSMGPTTMGLELENVSMRPALLAPSFFFFLTIQEIILPLENLGGYRIAKIKTEF